MASDPALLRRLRFPVLLKPRRGVNGEGIRHFGDAASLLQHMQGLGAGTAEYLVQSFIAGEDIDCSVLCDRGTVLAYTIQRPFLPALHAYGPSPGVRFLAHSGVLETVERLAASLEWSGIAHIDLREDGASGQPYILEVNPRYWGSLLGSLSVGVNFPYLSCLAALRIPFPRPTYATGIYVSKHRLMSPLAHAGRGRLAPQMVAYRDTIWRYTLADPLPPTSFLVKRNWNHLRWPGCRRRRETPCETVTAKG